MDYQFHFEYPDLSSRKPVAEEENDASMRVVTEYTPEQPTVSRPGPRVLTFPGLRPRLLSNYSKALPRQLSWWNRFQEHCFNRSTRGFMSTINDKRIYFLKLQRKVLTSVIALLVLLNILLAGFENEIFFNNYNASNETTNTYRWAIAINSFIICSLVIIYYLLKLQIDKQEMLRLKEDNLFTSKLIYWMLLEIGICMIFCPPNIDTTVSGYMLKGKFTYSIDAMLSVCQLFKSYWFLRVWIEYSMWTGQHAARVCKKFRVKSRIRFALKSELRYRSLTFLLTVTICSILILGQAVRTVERYRSLDLLSSTNKFKNDMANVSDGWWLMILTMSTVGFGDIFPQTHFGRLFCILASILGQLLVSLLVVSLAASAEFTQEESKAYHTIKKIKVITISKETACQVIQKFLRYYFVIKQQDPKSHAERFLFQFRLRAACRVFEEEMISSQIDNLPLDEMMRTADEKIKTSVIEIKVELDKLRQFDHRLEAYLKQQKQTHQQLDSVIRSQHTMTNLMKYNN